MKERLIAESLLLAHRQLHAHSSYQRGAPCATCENIREYLREKAGEPHKETDSPVEIVPLSKTAYA